MTASTRLLAVLAAFAAALGAFLLLRSPEPAAPAARRRAPAAARDGSDDLPALQAAVRDDAARDRPARRAGRGLPAPRPHDRRPRLLRARRRPAARRPRPCAARPRRARRERRAGALAPRLPPRPGARPPRPRGAARRARPGPADRRRARRARPLRRRRARAAAARRHQAHAGRLRPRLLPARAARRPRRRRRRHAPRGRRRRRRHARAPPPCRRCSAGSSWRAANLAAAGRAQRAALAAVPGYPAALAGLRPARRGAGRPGRRRRAAGRRSPRGCRCPSTSWRSARRAWPRAAHAAARREFRLVGAERRLLGAAGVDTDAETAVYEADHGAPRRALALARRAWRAAPGVRAADAMGWALTRAGRPAAGLRWAHRALALGSRDPLLRHHAGLAALAAGRDAEGRAHLRVALAGGLAGWPWQAQQARTGTARGGASMRIRIALAAAVAALGIAAAPAAAHPLGNFSVNHVTQVRISADRVDVRYLLDQAEIPTFRERGLGDAEVLRRKRDEVARRLVLTVDGRTVALRPGGAPRLTHPAGQGGLRTTRLELPLTAAVRGARTVAVRDGTFPGRVGWKAVQALPGRGTAVRTGAPATDPTAGCGAIPPTCWRARATCATRRSRSRPGTARWTPRRAASHGRRDRRRRLRRPARRRRRARPPAARRVRLGRGARALARARQGDGGGLPRRHARQLARRRSCSAPP